MSQQDKPTLLRVDSDCTLFLKSKGSVPRSAAYLSVPDVVSNISFSSFIKGRSSLVGLIDRLWFPMCLVECRHRLIIDCIHIKQINERTGALHVVSGRLQLSAQVQIVVFLSSRIPLWVSIALIHHIALDLLISIFVWYSSPCVFPRQKKIWMYVILPIGIRFSATGLCCTKAIGSTCLIELSEWLIATKLLLFLIYSWNFIFKCCFNNCNQY